MPAGYQIKQAGAPWEHAAAAALRRAVFCDEQGLFAGDDRDAIDADAITLVAIAHLGAAWGEVVGTVRLHEESPGLWWGSRLAVAAPYRRVAAIGTALIRLAVSTAHARGCTRFLAHVQAQNAALFHRLHWTTEAEVTLHGHPHHRMQAALDAYPPIARPEIGFLSIARRAA
nr:MSMEG_0567/Sll0786 family nitrogen starvation N-acetyltransferase [Plastoroseomonas arctica]